MEGDREMNPSQKDFLLEVAGRYIWWQTSEEALVRPQRVLARVMNLGVWEDWIRMAELFPPDVLADVLDGAEIGQFSARSWSFWHCRLNRELPSMPRRIVYRDLLSPDPASKEL